MSENLKKEETSNRKRRTKEEIEEAKKNGTYKPRKSKTDSTTELPAEQSVLIMACLQPQVSKKCADIAKKNGVNVVFLEDRVIYDYLNVKNNKDNEEKSLKDFLSDTSNRLNAEDKCVKLWNILTGDKPIENSDEYVFNRTEVVRKTNLSHSKADSVLQLLKAFGMLRFTKGNYEFVLNFSKNRCHDTIKTEIVSMCNVLKNDILRFKSSIESDDKLSDEQRKEMINEINEIVKKTIND